MLVIKVERRSGSIFFLKNTVLGLGLGFELTLILTLILTLKQYSLNKEIDPDPVIFGPNWGLIGRKKIFKAASHYLSVWMTPPPPPLIWGSGYILHGGKPQVHR